MSYNIDTFKLKELNDIKFPVDALYKNPREDWHPDRVNNDDGTVTFTNMETELTGNIDGRRFPYDWHFLLRRGQRNRNE